MQREKKIKNQPLRAATADYCHDQLMSRLLFWFSVKSLEKSKKIKIKSQRWLLFIRVVWAVLQIKTYIQFTATGVEKITLGDLVKCVWIHAPMFIETQRERCLDAPVVHILTWSLPHIKCPCFPKNTPFCTYTCGALFIIIALVPQTLWVHLCLGV